jgi:RNA polymerase sigma-70 factor (ECF subfamily)
LTDRLEADRVLAQRILNSDEAAFEELVGAHFRQVSRIAGRFFRAPEAIEEVSQEVFVKAFTGMSGYRAEMPLEHWLSKIAVHSCYDRLRREKRERKVLQPLEIPPELLSSGAGWEKEEARLLAEQLLAQLPEGDRLVLTLLLLEEMSTSEIAKLTGWSIANVKIRAFRARMRMRKLLNRRSVRKEEEQ